MRMLLLVAFRNIIHARRRSLLLGGAIASVTMLLILLLALSGGVRGSFLNAVGAVATGHVNVGGFFKTDPTTASAVVTGRDALMKVVTENTTGVSYVVDRHRGMVRVISSASSTRGSVLTGIDIDEEVGLVEFLELVPEHEYLEGGRREALGDVRRLAEPRTAVLFASQAEHLEVGVGDMVTARSETPGAPVNTVDLEVVAVVRDVGLLSNWTLFTSKPVVLELFQFRPDTTGVIQVYLNDVERSEQVAGHLREVLASEGYELLDHTAQPYFWKFPAVSAADWTGQKLDLTSWRDEVSYLTWILQAIDTIALALIAILLGIIAIGIMNTMVMATRERTRELGTLRAIGMTRSGVLVMILIEALVLGAMGAGVGAALGAAMAYGIDAAQLRVPSEALREILLTDIIAMKVRASHLAAAVVSLTLFTGFAAAWPAFRAARMQPVTAMHEVD